VSGHASAIEAYQSGPRRIAVSLRFEARSIRDLRARRLMKEHGELSVAGPLVIVVDDDLAVRNSLEFSLEVEGFTVRAYAGGDALLDDVARLRDGGCLVVDQNMAGMSGLDVIAQLRARAVAVPAILITSHPSMALSQRAAKAGVAIVEKPFLGTALIDRIRDLLSRGSSADGC
jgi:two-component system response regulator FixJ